MVNGAVYSIASYDFFFVNILTKTHTTFSLFYSCLAD